MPLWRSGTPCVGFICYAVPISLRYSFIAVDLVTGHLLSINIHLPNSLFGSSAKSAGAGARRRDAPPCPSALTLGSLLRAEEPPGAKGVHALCRGAPHAPLDGPDEHQHVREHDPLRSTSNVRRDRGRRTLLRLTSHARNPTSRDSLKHGRRKVRQMHLQQARCRLHRSTTTRRSGCRPTLVGALRRSVARWRVALSFERSQPPRNHGVQPDAVHGHAKPLVEMIAAQIRSRSLSRDVIPRAAA